MSRPSILLITTDQQRFDTVHAAGNPHIFTPNLNWVQDTGIRFARAYSDCPVCMPARAGVVDENGTLTRREVDWSIDFLETRGPDRPFSYGRASATRTRRLIRRPSSGRYTAGCRCQNR